MGDFQDIIDAIQKGTFGFLGLMCFLIFVINAVLLAWLIVKKGSTGLARCPKCGRTIACPHCEDADDYPDSLEIVDDVEL